MKTMAALRCGRRIFSMRNNLFQAPRRNDSGYIVLLPEIGEDLPEKNPFLKEETLLPEFDGITIERCIAAIAKQSMEFEQGIKILEKEIEVLESEKIDIFKDVLEPIEKLEIPLQTTWGISKILYFGNQSLMPSKCYYSIHKRAWTATTYKYNSKPIYEACKKLSEETKDLTEEQKRILSKYLLEGKLNGLDLHGKKKDYFQLLLKQIDSKCDEFRQKLELATGRFKHKVTDSNLMKGFPLEFLKSVATDPTQYEVGPWVITLEPHVVQTFMEYCPDSMLRWNIWLANNLRCSNFLQQELQTSPLVNTITAHRCSIGETLGFKHYVDMSMCTKMVGSTENVYKFLNTLLQAAFPSQVKEIEELSSFANERGYDTKLEQWDVAYWARKQKRSLYNYDEEVLKEYFPLPNVLNGLFTLLKNLFNISIVERKEVSVWHNSVRFFDMYDLDVSDTEAVGSFYFDPYFRDKNKLSANRHSGWVLLIRQKSEIYGNKPLTMMIFNLQSPSKDGQPTLLTFKAVLALFENFGHVMQQLLSRTQSAEVSGLSNVEWDAAAMTKHLMSHFLYEPQVLKSISSHSKTGLALDDETVQNLRNARTHMAGYYLCKELYLSRLDLDLHSVDKIWERIMKKAWKEHFVFPEHKKDSHICSWDSIFVDNLAAAYYGDLWSKMLAADVYSAFQELQSDDIENRSKIGNRFKETFLALGGSVSASEIFRRFRGRDPNLTAFIQSLNLKS